MKISRSIGFFFHMKKKNQVKVIFFCNLVNDKENYDILLFIKKHASHTNSKFSLSTQRTSINLPTVDFSQNHFTMNNKAIVDATLYTCPRTLVVELSCTLMKYLLLTSNENCNEIS